MTDTQLGLRVHVLRSASLPDCTNNGISNKHAHLTIVGIITPTNETHNMATAATEISPDFQLTALPATARLFPPSADAPAAVLRYSRGRYSRLNIAPLDACLAGRWVMAGGNYAETTDSRWNDLLRTITDSDAVGSAVPIHDRIEH